MEHVVSKHVACIDNYIQMLGAKGEPSHAMLFVVQDNQAAIGLLRELT